MLAAVLLFAGLIASPARAAELVPCVAAPPTTPVTPVEPTVEIDGEANLVTGGKAGKALRRARVKQRLLRPAGNATGRPTYPVADVSYDSEAARVTLGGGLRLIKGKRKLEFSSPVVVVGATGKVAVSARYAGGSKRFFNVKNATLKRNSETGELYLQSGSARLTAAASREIRKRFGKRLAKQLKAGTTWGVLDVYAVRRVTTPPPPDPEGEAPEEPPVLARPAGATSLTGASVEWRVRDSFIQYVSSGTGAKAIDGAVPGPLEEVGGAAPLIYRFSFPFASGWTDTASQRTLVKGNGGVAFRHCVHTINFQVTQPEIELNGGLSRMIFRVNGTDGTAYPNSRAVVVGLRLNEAESVETVGDTTTYTGIPGFIPEGSGGIFADFYLPGTEFGSLTISFTKP